MDVYDHIGIDDEEQKELDAAQRRTLERQMNQRERMRQGGRQAEAFMEHDEDSETYNSNQLTRRQ